jgi:hypothetical protein
MFIVILSLQVDWNQKTIQLIDSCVFPRGKAKSIASRSGSWIKRVGTVKCTSDYTLLTWYRSYSKGISANIELQVYSVTCC